MRGGRLHQPSDRLAIVTELERTFTSKTFTSKTFTSKTFCT